MPAPTEKLQKVLARMGYGSRREIETWIAAGRVEVNGKIAQLGDRVAARVRQIKIDGKPVNITAEKIAPRVIMYHKPPGEICTRHDPENRPTVFEFLPPVEGKWLSVGRLDLNTTGLLLFTNDGELANRLMHPSKTIEREYAVRVFGTVSDEILRKLLQGVTLEDGRARFKKIIFLGGEGTNHWYRVVVTEGRNRIVRRLWESQGMSVNRLVRVRFGPIILEKKLRPAKWAELSPGQLKQLMEYLK